MPLDPDETFVLHFDGGSRGNPGPAGYGAVVVAADGTVLRARGGFVGVATNNVAEYRGLIACLALARELGARRVEVRGDSELVVKQMRGEYKVRNAHLKPLWEQAAAEAKAFESVRYVHNVRAHNKLADDLANRAMDRRGDVED